MPITIDGQEYLTMGDAAYAAGLKGTAFDIGAGYYGGPMALHIWPKSDWKSLPGKKLPIWVAGWEGVSEGLQAVAELRSLGVPTGSYTAVDMETRKDITYCDNFGRVLHHAGYKVWVYGSAETVFRMPALNGYWVADYAGIGAFMYLHAATRATQYQSGSNYDSSLVKKWTGPNFWT